MRRIGARLDPLLDRLLELTEKIGAYAEKR
jgi:hypothetical protein